MAWTPDMTAEMRTARFKEWPEATVSDERDLRDPDVLGHKLLKLRDSDELKKKYPLAAVYDFFWA